jgi:protein-L-isoaspartate O-methyltransferase
MIEISAPTYVTSVPSEQNALDLFQGEWSSLFPPPLSHLRAGQIPLFQDSRIAWMIQSLGGVEGFRVLELGPLEGGHSYMLDRAGAAAVTSVEANPRAFMKCLTAKELLGMPKVSFRLGDFREFLGSTEENWDLCVASGVLYHMLDPVELLKSLAQRSDRIFLWTHYYDEAVIQSTPYLSHRFGKSITGKSGSFSYTLHRLNYLEALESKAFTGGSAQYSHWLPRADIFGALEHFGFKNFLTNDEKPDHPHGPSFSILATR